LITKIDIFDMDGTVIDSTHRYRTMPSGDRIDLDHWIENDIPEMIARDSLLPMAEQYKKACIDPQTYVIIATARACEDGDANYQFIEKHLGLPDKFIHREGRSDTRGGAELKLKGIKPLLNLKQFVNAKVRVFEDNISYLKKMCDTLDGIGIYVPSKQGH